MERNEPPLPIDKIVIFKLRGGSEDGQTIRSDEMRSPEEKMNVHFHWFGSNGGQVGKKLITMNPLFKRAALKGNIKGAPKTAHHYEIVERHETATEIVVLLEHRSVT